MYHLDYDFRPLEVQRQEQDMQAALLAASPTRKALQPLQRQVAGSIPPSVSASNEPSIPTSWPMFANDAERNIAIGTGAYDPSYVSPLKMIEHQVMTADAIKDIAQRQAYDVAMNPVIPGQAPEERIASMLTGDITGTAHKIVNKGYSPDKYGQLDLNSPTRDLLDRDVYDDPDFRKLLAKSPEHAAFTYKQLTGRSLEGDTKAAITYRDDRTKFAQSLQDERAKKISEEQLGAALLPTKVGRAYAEQQIKSGAVYDPTKQTWKVWNVEDAPEAGTLGLGAAPKPYRQLTDATDDQNRLLNQHYSDVTGRRLPDKPKSSQLSGLRKDPMIEEAATKFEAAHHRTIQNDELAALSHRLLQTQSTQAESDQHGFWGTVPKVSEDTLRAVVGRKSGAPVFSSDPSSVDPENLNWWGKYLNEALHGQVDPNGNHIMPSINHAYNYMTDDLWQTGGPVHQLFDKLGWAQQPVPR